MRDLVSALGGALERGEISAAFQPQIDLATGAVVAAEALCRWTHPEWGAVPPVEFIAVAEDSGLIDRIGRFMAEECCKALSEWSTPERPIDVSVNVSPLQLATPAFSLWLADCLRRNPPPAGSFTIEITESKAIGDLAPVLRRLRPLREVGVGIALDDFGSGHASLTQLRRLHGTEIKLDRMLVADRTNDATRTIANVVDVAHRAGIRVVAEGIETEADLARVRDLGCDRGQGYLIARPMPHQAMTAFLRAA